MPRGVLHVDPGEGGQPFAEAAGCLAEADVELAEALQADDLDAAFGWLTGSGAEAVCPPAAAVQPGARFADVKDPEGNLIELIHHRAVHDAATAQVAVTADQDS